MKAKVLCKFNKKQANERIISCVFFIRAKNFTKINPNPRVVLGVGRFVCEPAFKGLFVARSHSDMQGILWQRTCENKRADSKCDL